MESNEKLRRMFRDLGRTLAEAISDSSDASRTLRQLHHEGYAISLGLARSNGQGPQETLTVILEKRPLDPDSPPNPPEPPSTSEPAFRIYGRDLAFLRSIGIDPTRRPRRRRR